MPVSAFLFWCLHRRHLRAQGYTLRTFSAATIKLWNNMASAAEVLRRPAPPTSNDLELIFSRRELRTRW